MPRLCDSYLEACEFAALAGISVRAAQKALRGALAGRGWRNTSLHVRSLPSRGGRSGLRYQVAIASLPPEIAARLGATTVAQSAVPNPGSGKDWRLALVQSIQDAGSPGSKARTARLRAVAAQAKYASGKRAGQSISERTIRAWVAAAEGGGFLAVAGAKRRADRGTSRVIAWREWDRAMREAGVPEARQREIAARLDADVRGLWAGGEVSAANVQFSMTIRCRTYAEEAGIGLPESGMVQLCRMPLHYAGEKSRRRARIAHLKRTDAARWASHHVPRVRRHRNGMRPMDLVAVDVRHSDILYRRPDGSLATPKVIAFLDLATNRLFARAFLLPKGEMIRREHVLMVLRDLAADPAWGLWRGLYLDNGGEFKLGAAPEDLTRLVDLVRTVHDDDAAGACGNVTSRPYNPQSKVIEGIFSAFTRSIEPVYQGFIGGNRMAKKTQNQGRAPQPLPGDEADILSRFAEMVAFYNAKPQQKGHIRGRSPDEAFAAFVSDTARPWGAILLDPREFALAFGPDEWRTVQPGGEIHIRNRVLRHPELATMVGEKVRVRLPILDPTRAVLLTDKNEPVLVASEVETLGLREIAGVREHDRGRRAAARAAVAASGGAPVLDPSSARAAALRALPASVPPAPVATASVHPVLHEAAGHAGHQPEPAARRGDPARQAEALALVTEALRRAG